MKKILLIYVYLNFIFLSAQVKDTIPPEKKSEALEEVVISGTLKTRFSIGNTGSGRNLYNHFSKEKPNVKCF